MRPLLFTPGPANVTDTVKQAMTVPDVGSRDNDFMEIMRAVREKLTALADDSGDYTTVLLSGSGTSAMEAAVSSVVPPGGKMLVVVNGAYGQRLAEIAATHGIEAVAPPLPWDQPLDVRVIAEALQSNQIACLAMTHHETTTGMRNPVAEIGALAKQHGAIFIVDAISSFGGIPFRLSDWYIDYLIGSSNKCLQGVPGVPFVVARRDVLERLSAYEPRTLSLNLYTQYRSLEDTGQSLFTPNTHAMLALQQALQELDDEGGVAARYARYTANWRALRAGLTELGVDLLLREEDEAHLLITAKQPAGFDYEKFYAQMKARGITIYSGKLVTLSGEATLRFGVIGDLHLPDIKRLLAAITEVLVEMKIEMPRTSHHSR
ncbi:MAG TPA: 2-aminoethylphosphonate--pyruvate transaminase [Candidatus Andersenbacteria bacterium]|nr:MAG: hypothetical protein A2854_04680 [Parcubacteria group bacterium RIFCSPHIGHO2_01_FULL_56_18]HLD25504.1 2-aminoethylphosphonate--pyruvate transaminase [Candidatus Andersenbacteria bacterium]